MSRRLSLLLLVGLCFNCTTYAYQEERPSVVATASMLADMAKVIGGEYIQVSSIVPIGGDPHIYDATPKDAQLVYGADLILRNGLTFEGWLNELIENSGSKATLVTVTDGITPIASMQYANATDPHAWMDAHLGLLYIENVKNALIELDSLHADVFQANYEAYASELKELDAYIKSAIQSIPESQRILITSHDAFQYFGRRYGLRLESVLGTSTDADVQTSDIMRLNKVIKENRVPAVFIESTINPKLLEQIATDQKVKIGGKLFADSLGDSESGAATYLEMLRHNTDVIVKALSAPFEKLESVGAQSNNWWLYTILCLGCVAAFYYLYKRVS